VGGTSTSSRQRCVTVKGFREGDLIRSLIPVSFSIGSATLHTVSRGSIGVVTESYDFETESIVCLFCGLVTWWSADEIEHAS
jgi:hypothetical protein